MSQQLIETKSGRVIALPSPQEDAAIDAAIVADSDSHEWTGADFASAKPASAFFDSATHAKLVQLQRKPGERGPQKAPTKVATTIRLSPDVAAAFKATGAGWQTRIDAALKDWLKTHSPA
jgi:uncharacterized protein (DUF4415 family)